MSHYAACAHAIPQVASHTGYPATIPQDMVATLLGGEPIDQEHSTEHHKCRGLVRYKINFTIVIHQN